jgi:hypothetical protein
VPFATVSLSLFPLKAAELVLIANVASCPSFTEKSWISKVGRLKGLLFTVLSPQKFIDICINDRTQPGIQRIIVTYRVSG